MNPEETLFEVAVKLVDRAVKVLPRDVEDALRRAYKSEVSETGLKILEAILSNVKTAREEGRLICQDTGSPVFFVEEGLAHPWRINYRRVFAKAVSEATKKVPLRPNIVHPLTRVNTGDNTGLGTPIVHVSKAEGSLLKVSFMPKGAGSENMSSLHMLTPSEGVESIKRVVLRRVVEAGGMPCPPTVIGIGIGGTADEAMLMAKKALLKPLGERNEDPMLARLEEELLEAVNQTGIGPMGLGGRWTCLDVKVEYKGCHTASLPLAINFQCWAARRASAVIEPDGSYRIVQP